MIVAWPIIQTFIQANWKIFAVIAGTLGLLAWHKIEVNRSWYAGRAALKAEQVEEAKRRNADAQEADAAARRCTADPACRLQDDGFRRD